MKPSELTNHLRRGGAATLNHPATYEVAEGAVIAPARYAGRQRQGAQFVFETRFVDGEFRRTALIDSKQSQSNRAEEGLLAARREGGPAARIPVIEVAYDGRDPLTDMELPHRSVDAHVRFATQDGEPVVNRAWYRALRDANAADYSPVFVTSPASLAFGSWDSSRRSGQLRLRGLFVSELFGVVAQDEAVSQRSGARLDPLGQDFHVSPDELAALLDRQREHLSETKVQEVEQTIEAARKKGKERLSAAVLGLGGIPPQTDVAFGVSVARVHRARTFSLAGLRHLRFGGSADEDAAARAALLAMLLLGAAYADADPALRAYCDVGKPRGRVFLDDEEFDLDLSIEACESYLEECIVALPERLAWTGQVQRVEGDPGLNRGALAESQEQE